MIYMLSPSHPAWPLWYAAEHAAVGRIDGLLERLMSCIASTLLTAVVAAVT